MKLTPEQIKEINAKYQAKSYSGYRQHEQGIFKEPFGIPTAIKEPVIYLNYASGGYSGGGYRDIDNAEPWTLEPKEIPKFEVLDDVLRILKPDLSYLTYRQIEAMIQTNEKTQNEYYGNSTDHMIQWIVLQDLENFLA